MKVHTVQVTQNTGKNKGKTHFLVVRKTIDGKITVPTGYTLVCVVNDRLADTFTSFRETDA